MNLDFGDKGANNSQSATTPANEGQPNSVDLNSGQEDVTIGGARVEDMETVAAKPAVTPPATTPATEPPANTTPPNETTPAITAHTYEVGTVLETDEGEFTVGANGDLVDKDGKVFKTASEVKEWTEGLEATDPNDFTIANIQEALGYELTGENDEPLSFENTPEGVNAYVSAVIESQREVIHEEAVNQLYTEYPILEDVLNYYVANNNSLDGYNELQDRSQVVIEEDNEDQQEAIVRAAWKEGNKGDASSYIAYLKSSGILHAEAQKELEFLQAKDVKAREDIARQAQEENDRQYQDTVNYWKGINDIVSSGAVAGFKLPESIERTIDGVKKVATRQDFYNYMHQVNKDGQSQYELDLAKQDPVVKANDQVLKAFLKFTGGGYSNLVKMAINEEQVKRVRFNAKNNSGNNQIKVKSPQTPATTATSSEKDFGYR